MRKWQLQDAKNKFSQVVDIALAEGPQVITRHGKAAAVVLSFEAYSEMVRPALGLAEFFARSPLAEVELEFTRDADLGRDVGI